MTRTEICTTLTELRKQSGLRMKDVCFKLDTTPNIVYRIESGKGNFDATKLLQYLDALNAQLYVNAQEVSNSEELANIIAAVRNAAGLTQREIAEKIGKTFVSVAYMEKQKSTIMVDTLLAICDVCGATISLERRHDHWQRKALNQQNLKCLYFA